jgi:ketosteroid isomerase-like protein
MNTSAFDARHFSKTSIRACLVLMVVLLGLTAQAQESVNNEDNGARVTALETLWNQAETAKDASALDHLLAEKFIFVDIDGSVKTKAEFLASVKNPPEHLNSVGNESMSTQAYENTVIVTGIYREKGTRDGKPYLRRGRFTDTWIKQGGGWLCAASQSTLIQK